MKILSIVGARPQFIKLAPLSKALRKMFNEVIVHTGQHFDEEMSALFFQELEIPEPDFNLNISGGDHGEQTGRMLISIEEIILKEKPDLTLVFGDTNSTLAGSLAATKLNVKLLHIEAGLRSFNKGMPEEINRIISDHISDYLFAPTKTALNNLINEGMLKQAFLSGDIMVDSLKQNLEKSNKFSNIMEILSIDSNKFYLLTLHRPYTVDNPDNLKLILDKLSSLDKEIIFPVHPRTKKIIESSEIRISNKIKLIKPVGYLDFIMLEQTAEKIITDSGGIQKEAYIFKKPCITLRSETEWIETVDDGWNILLLPNNNNFCESILKFTPTEKQRDVFGSDVAAKMINQIQKILTP